ncbi:unnamed protein product [Calypogeia fissa]
MESSFGGSGGVGSSPRRQGGVRRFQKGELVEVRQREKGLRGSWHPAVIIGVKAGRRLVEYDELLTDDGREKLTENIPVGRYVDGGRLGPARQPWKSSAKRPRTLLRPRPPPLPDPFSISWSQGLSVECFFKDAWWEGVLTEAIPNMSRQKRASVWFPEEEDWEAMPVKDIRVGQQWDEDTGAWSLKGLVDIPISKRSSNRSRTMSLSQKTRGFARNRRRRSPDSMELAIALKIDGTSTKDEYTSAWNGIGKTKDDPDAEISVQLNSPKCTALVLRQAGTHQSSGDSPKEQNLQLALRTRSSESSPVPLSSRSPRPRTRGGSVWAAAPSSGREENDNAGSDRRVGAFAVNGNEQGGGHAGSRMGSRSGGILDRFKLDGDKLFLIRENGKPGKNGTGKMGQLNVPSDFSPEQDEQVKELIGAGWSISRHSRANGRTQWYYRSPNGCLMGSLVSALAMCRQMEVYNTSGDDDNATLSDVLTPKSQRGSPHAKGRLGIGTGRTVKSSRRIGSPNSVKEGGQEMDQLEVSIVGHANGDVVSKVGPPAGSNGTLRSSNTESAIVLFSPQSNYKRNALESEVIANDGKLNELKRRKVQDSSVQQNKPNNFNASLANGSPIEGFDGNPIDVLSVEVTPLGEKKPAEVSNSLPGDGGPATETRSKKRAYLTEGVQREQGNDLFNSSGADDRRPSMDHEPRSKKSKVTTEASSPSEGKSRKTLAILQESSRKKGSTPHKGADSKQAKKSTTQVKKSTSQVKKGKKSRTPARVGVRLEVLLSAPGGNREGEGDLTKKRTLLSWLIDNGTVNEHEKVRYLHRKDLHCMLEGYVTRDGILCNCCNKVVTLSVFEAHAGSKLHRPSANIFLDDGRSLSVCQVEALAAKTQSETDSQKGLGDGSLDKSDDTCGICGDGGELICCDHCPSTFHLTCMGLQEVPDGDWYCPNCRCSSCGESQFNGDQTTFNDLTVIKCEQCECEYHVKCLRARGLSLSSFPQGDFFCGESCEKIFQGLRSLVGICTPMEGGFSWTLLRSGADDDRKSGCISNAEMNAEHDSKLSIALSVMQECFRPMIDPRTKIDIITHVLYNRRSDVSRLNYHGFYTMLLERGDELISVATIRVHGARLAEMPLIGTRFQYRRQGMCRRLMSAIEQMLHSLEVERLVLPAVPELLETWTAAFGFQSMDESERLKLMDLNIMAFPGTSTLYKRLDIVEPLRGEALRPARDEPPTAAEIIAAILLKEHPDASPPLSAKRGRGRPPKVKEEIINLDDELALALPAATVGAPENFDHTARHSESPVPSQYVAVKRGRGRPPKNCNALFKPSNGAKLAVSMAVVGTHGLGEGHDTGHTCSPTEGVSGKAVSVTRLSKDGGHQLEKETVPTIVRKKRGRPPRARMNYNLGSTILSATATSIQVDQVAGFHGGRIQVSTSAGGAEVEATHRIFPLRSSDGKFTSIEVRGDDEYSNAAIISKATRSMREVQVKTPMWLVKSVNHIVPRNALARERSCKTIALEAQTDIPPLESSTTGSTRIYERRKSGLSPSSENEPLLMSQDDGSDGEPICGHLDLFEDGRQRVTEPGVYEAVSVPIRTFPSQFGLRGDNTPPGTFIPVETIVVNSSQSNADSLDEFLVPECAKVVEPSRSEREEQKGASKLLLRLKLPKKKMSPDAKCDLEISQQSPTLKLPNGGLLPPTFTVCDQISNDVNRFEKFDKEQLKQPESTMSSHCIPVPVS